MKVENILDIPDTRSRWRSGTVRARTGKRAPQAHDVGSPPDYILPQISQAGSLRPVDENACERVRGLSALADPAVRQRFADQGQAIPAPEQQSPEALGAHQRAEIKKWWPVIKAAGIKAY